MAAADDYDHLRPMSAADWLNEASLNVHLFDAQHTDVRPIGAPVGERLFTSAFDTLRSYIVPKQFWRYYSTAERKDNWVTPQIPDNVSLQGFSAFRRPRIAYVSEYNWQRTGARGMYAITHYGRANWGLAWVIGSPISPALYARPGSPAGQSAAKFAILARNTYWMSAAIGGLKVHSTADADFVVHYNDGDTYRLLYLPWVTFTDFVYSQSSLEERELVWPDRTEPEGAVVLLGDDTPLGSTVSDSVALAAGATPGTSDKLIAPNFKHVDLTRFWPQFLAALDIAIMSPTKSLSLWERLTTLDHWEAVRAFMEQKSGRIPWVPPRHDSSMGKVSKPDYLSE